jgi:hypothetical protein
MMCRIAMEVVRDASKTKDRVNAKEEGLTISVEAK